MIDFPRSFFTWKTFPWKTDPYYKYAGGFIGQEGDVRHVRFNLEARCAILDEINGKTTELFVGAPCRSEYTIPRRNLFQIPNDEFRMAFSRSQQLPIARYPSNKPEAVSPLELRTAYQAHQIDIREHPHAVELGDRGRVVEATLANDLLNACSTYRHAKHNLQVTVEYPVNLINVNQQDATFQVCTGPLILPDLTTWNGQGVSRVFLAHVAFSAFDYVEFILRREVEAAPAERVWLDQPRGRNRLELHDPNKQPPGYPPPGRAPKVYNEVWEREAVNVVLRVPNP